MWLPNREQANVPLKKLTDYLLSERHTDGKSKAVFFRRLGFSSDNVRLLSQALMNIANDNEVFETSETSYGTKYIVDGLLSNPQDKPVRVRTVWIIDQGRSTPRFVTAYPAR